MIVDYYVIRHQQLDLPELYRYDGRYGYRGGINPAAIIALIIGVLLNVPGFLTAIGVLGKGAMWPALVRLYKLCLVYWFCRIGAGILGADARANCRANGPPNGGGGHSSRCSNTQSGISLSPDILAGRLYRCLFHC